MRRNLVCTLILLIFYKISNVNSIGKCNLSAAPPSWLSTNGTGISDWATAGKPTNGSNFCIQGNKTSKTFQVDYHIDLGTIEMPKQVSRVELRNEETKNGCINNNTRILYCFPLCFNETLQNLVIESALKSNEASQVALDIQNTVHNNWAITVIQVDYNDPKAHLNASVFLEPNAWCSVYIGIKPKTGFDYLFEIQLGKILE